MQREENESKWEEDLLEKNMHLDLIELSLNLI